KPSTRSATDVVLSRSRCSIGTDVSSFFVGFRMAMGAAIRAPAKRVRFSGFLLALDRFRDRPGFVPRTRADRVLVPIEKHVEIGILPLDFLDPLHDVLEGDRLVVRVDPQNDPLLALRPHGPLLSGSLQIIIRFFRAYKYSRAPTRASFADSVRGEDRISGARMTAAVPQLASVRQMPTWRNGEFIMEDSRGAGSEIS